MHTATFSQPPQRSQQRTRWAFATLASALLLGCSSLGYSATLADVKLVDRNSGQRLTVYQHQGEYWVAGRPGASYSVDISNRTGQRILAVISVDGVNALNGQTASATPDDGYVLTPWQSWAITGWRKSDSQVAAFYFSESDASYASRTGRPRDVGVIGVALFRERVPEPVRPPPVTRRSPVDERYSPRMNESDKSSSANADMASSVAAEAPMPAPAPQAAPAAKPMPLAAASAEIAADAAAMPSSSPSANADSKAARAEKRAPSSAPRAPSLGTGHGALETSHTRTVDFDSATQRPEQVVRIRYDSYANLVAKGIIRQPRPQPERSPNAFPADAQRSYVPDPPNY